jgi:hypothetical protein
VRGARTYRDIKPDGSSSPVAGRTHPLAFAIEAEIVIIALDKGEPALRRQRWCGDTSGLIVHETIREMGTTLGRERGRCASTTRAP